MPKRNVEVLFNKYKDGTASEQEINELLSWIQQYEEAGIPDFSLEELEKVQQELADRLPLVSNNEKRIVLWPRFVAAASVIFLLSFGAYLFFKPADKQNTIVQKKVTDVKPGLNQATLTLADGKKIILTKNLQGKIAQQGGVLINVDADSSITYKVNGESFADNGTVSYNTLTTQKGEQSPFPLVLSDGTKVWLNAASSLVFPTNFNGSKREVQLKGEAYFEVAHNARKPFLVRSGNQVVQDIGTAFNISSYEDELKIKTTLVEGAAKVFANGDSKMLKPGEQAHVGKDNITLTKADIESETAWLSGKFIFRDKELHDVMRELSRWYNIKVVYENEPQNVMLGGGFSKNRNISKVLRALEQTGAVKFKIQGNTVTVTR